MHIRRDQKRNDEHGHAEICVHQPWHGPVFTGDCHQAEDCRQGQGRDVDVREHISDGKAGYEEKDDSGDEGPDGYEAELAR